MSSDRDRRDRDEDDRIEAALELLHEGLPAPPWSLALTRDAPRRDRRALAALALAVTAAASFAAGWWVGAGGPGEPAGGARPDAHAEVADDEPRLIVPAAVAELSSWRPTTDVLLAGAMELAAPPQLELWPASRFFPGVER